MFEGQYDINLDEKGRIAIPTRYRDDLRELSAGQLTCTVHHGYDQCLSLYPSPDWETIKKTFSNQENRDPHAEGIVGLLLRSATPADMDKNGRVQLPKTLRERARLDGKLVLTGHQRRLEIWNTEAFDDYCAETRALNREAMRNPSDALRALPL